MQVVLLAGGLGYIGSHVANVLAKLADYQIILVDNLANSSLSRLDELRQLNPDVKFNFVEADLTNWTEVSQLFETYQFTQVICLAGFKAVGESIQMPINYYETNLLIVINLLKAMKQSSCRKLIFSSSATVYHHQAVLPYQEQAARMSSQTNPYALTKQTIEMMLENLVYNDQQAGWDIVIFRYFNPIGCDVESGLLNDLPVKPQNLFPVILNSLSAKQPFQVYGYDYPTPDGTAQRDYIHVADLAQAHLTVLQLMANQSDSQSKLDVLNVGTGEPVSVSELIRHFETANDVQLDYQLTSRRAGDLPVSYCDSTKLRQLGWQPVYSIRDAVTVKMADK